MNNTIEVVETATLTVRVPALYRIEVRDKALSLGAILTREDSKHHLDLLEFRCDSQEEAHFIQDSIQEMPYQIHTAVSLPADVKAAVGLA